MKHYIVHLEAGFCGMDAYELLSVEDDTPQSEIEDIVHDMALANAEMYGIYDANTHSEEDGIEDEDLSYNIEGYIVGEYDPKLHDMHRAGGGSFQDDIDRAGY